MNADDDVRFVTDRINTCLLSTTVGNHDNSNAIATPLISLEASIAVTCVTKHLKIGKIQL